MGKRDFLIMIVEGLRHGGPGFKLKISPEQLKAALPLERQPVEL